MRLAPRLIFILTALTLSGYIPPALAADQHGGIINCPANNDGHPVSRASLFDGPPEKMADLIPDNSTGEMRWDLTPYKKGKRPLYLVCRYKDTTATVQFTIPPDTSMSMCEEKIKKSGDVVICQ